MRIGPKVYVAWGEVDDPINGGRGVRPLRLIIQIEGEEEARKQSGTMHTITTVALLLGPSVFLCAAALAIAWCAR